MQCGPFLSYNSYILQADTTDQTAQIQRWSIVFTLNIYTKTSEQKDYKAFSMLNWTFQLLIKTKILKDDFSCFKTLRCCIYHANKC